MLNLRLRLTLLAAAIPLAGVAGLAFVLADRQETRLRESLTAWQSSTASYVAADIDSKIRLRLQGLSALADLLPERLLRDSARLTEFLAQHHAPLGPFDGGLIVVRPDGAGAFADWPPVPGRRSQRFDAFLFFRETVRSGRATIDRPLPGARLAKPILHFAAPIRSHDGVMIAILVGVSTLTAPNFLDLVGRQRPGAAGELLVAAPRHGVFVAGTDPASVLMPLPPPGQDKLLDRAADRFEGTEVVVAADGHRYLASVRQVPTADWYVLARLPADQAFAPARETRRFVLQAAALLALAAGLATAFLVRRTLMPIERIGAEFDAISRGTTPLHALPVGRRDDEAGRLMTSFNRLQDRLARQSAAVQESLQLARQLIEVIPSPVFYKDAEGRYLGCNEAFEEFIGRRRGDIVGRSVFDLSPPDLAERYQAADQALLDHPGRQIYETSVRGKDGLRQVVFHKATFARPDGSVGGLVGVILDVTDNRRVTVALEHSLRDFNELVENIPVGVFKYRVGRDGRRRFDYVSPLGCELLDLAADEIDRDAQAPFLRIHAEDREDFARRNETACRNHAPFEWQGRICRADGTVGKLRVEARATPVDDGNVLWDGILLDISER